MTLRRLRFAVLSVLMVVVFLAVSASLIYLAQHTAATGIISLRRGGQITAASHPIQFWTMVTMTWLFGVLCLAATPLMAWRAWKTSAKDQGEFEREIPSIYGKTRRSLTVALWILVIPVVLLVARDYLLSIR